MGADALTRIPDDYNNAVINPEHIAFELHHRLRKVRSNGLRVELTTGLFLGAAVLVTVALLGILLETVGEFSSVIRTAMVALLAAVFAAVLVWFVARPALRLAGVLKTQDDESVARRVGNYFPSLRDRLLNALQLAARSRANAQYYSPELTAKALEDLSINIASVDFTACVDVRPVPRSARWFALSVMVTLAVFLVFPGSTGDAVYRLIHFRKEFVPPPRVLFEVSPGSREIIKGQDVYITVRVVPGTRAFRKLPPDLVLAKRTEGQGAPDEYSLRPDSSGLYRMTMPAVRFTTEYFARYAGVESKHYMLTVLDRPIIRSFRVRLEPPSYTRLPSQLQDEFAGDVSAVEGTRVFVSGFSSKPLIHASLSFADSTHITMDVRATHFTGGFAVRANAEYQLVVMDAESLVNNDPVRYQVRVVPDVPPTVSILEPGRNIDLTGDKQLALLIQGKDDFGFSSLRLGYRLVKSRFEAPAKDYTYVSIPLPGETASTLEVSYSWKLASLNLVPEDVVEYFAEVFDNDAVRGPKSGRSATYLIRLPSLEEVFADAEQGHEKSLEELAQSLEEAKRLKEDVESINRDLKKNKDPDWQTQKKLENMVKKYEEIQKKVGQVQRRVDEMTQQMQQQNVLSPETMEKYLELQQLMEQLDSAELRRLLNQMQQSMPNISKEQLQQAMQQATFTEERFRQSIERTLNLLKRIQIEQRLDELKKRTDELTGLQKMLEEEAAASDSTGTATNREDPTRQQMERSRRQEELSRRQADLAQKEQSLEKSAKDLQQRMEEFFTEMPADKLQRMNQQLHQQRLDTAMQQAAMQLRQGNIQQAQQMQQEVQQQLDQYARQLDALQQQMLQQQTQAIVNAMRKATNDLLELSKDEERLKQQSQSAPSNSAQLRQNAQGQQKVIEDLQQVIKDLTELSQRSFVVTPEMGKAIGEALARMNNAMRGLDVRNGQLASQEQGQAMGALNRASLQVQNALTSMMQGGGGAGGLMQQLQQMAGQQMVLNVQTQQLGQGMTAQQAADAGRLARQQEAIRKSLEQLNREAQASADRQRLLGDLNKIAEEMKDVVRNLEQNDVNPETLRKQDRILSRLLDASKSMRERDYEKRRRAQTGRLIQRRGPAELDPNAIQGRDKLREDLLRALEQGYSKDYQDLIRKYFERLEQEGLLN